MAGKSSPALFELIRDPAVVRQPKVIAGAAPAPSTPAEQPANEPAPEVAASAATPAPTVEPVRAVPPRVELPDRPPPRPEPTPVSRQVVPASSPQPSRQEMLRPEPVPTNIAPSQPYAGLGNKLSLGGTIPLSTSILGIILAVVVVSWIIVWAMAYRVGFGRADEQAARELSLAAAPVTDPLVSEREPRPPSAMPTPTAGREPRIQTPPPVTERSSPPARAGVRAVMVPPERDPRLPDLNYYAIEGQLDRETAEDIVLFLASHGVESVAVDTSPPGTNNPRSYRVYGLKGFSSAEYRSPARPEYEQLISRLGEAYKRDHRGTTDLSRTYWERYRP